MTGKELFEDLKAVFESFSKNSEKLINVCSTSEMKILTEQWHQRIQNRISAAVQRTYRVESLQLLPRETQEQIYSRR